MRSLLAMLVGAILLVGLLGSPAQAAVSTKIVSPGYFDVAPGKIGKLAMRSTVKRAKRLGMIRWGTTCGPLKGWIPGRAHVRRTTHDLEYFPMKVTKRRVRSYWIKGEDWRTTKGLRSGATLKRAKRLYPRLRANGTAYDVSTQLRFRVHTVGSKKRGYLDLYYYPRDSYYKPGRLAFAFVRAPKQKVERGFADGC